MVRSYTPDEILRTLGTRRWLVLLPFAVGIGLTPLLEPLAPPLYRSETLIMVVPQRVPDTYVKSTITQTVEDRLPSITGQILSRTRLERIVNEMDLYKDDRQRMVMEDVVARMRQDVNITLVGKADNADSFRVSYVNQHAETARAVTERLASSVIEQNLADRNNQAESTSQFLDTQLQEAKRRLIEQEQKLEDYRRRHAGQMPTQLSGNLQAIQNANLQLQQLNESTNRAQERRLLLERQVADTQSIPLPVQVAGPEAPLPASTTQQLEVARARRAAYLQRYTADHPEVVGLERTISELVARLEQETPIGSTPAEVEPPMSAAEATQRKRILDLQAELTVIDHQLNGNRAEEERLRRSIADYQAKVDAVPTRESELVELTRDYSTLQGAYANLLVKREDSMIAANLERRQIGEQFRILDPASLPQRPFNEMKRLGVMSAGAGAGLALGLLIVALLEFRDSSFRREEEIVTRLSLPVLALVPVMASAQEVRRVKNRSRAWDIVGTCVLGAAVAVLAFWQL